MQLQQQKPMSIERWVHGKQRLIRGKNKFEPTKLYRKPVQRHNRNYFQNQHQILQRTRALQRSFEDQKQRWRIQYLVANHQAIYNIQSCK